MKQKLLWRLLTFIFLFFIENVCYGNDPIDSEMAQKLRDVKDNITSYDETKEISYLTLAVENNNIAFLTIKKWFTEESNKELEKGVELFKYGGLGVVSKIIELNAVKRDIYFSSICDNYNTIADKYTNLKEIDNAKNIYRDVIKSFDINKFRRCIKQAEFGLDDLKTLEAKEQERVEQELQEIKKSGQKLKKKSTARQKKE